MCILKYFWGIFCIVYVCLLIFRQYWGVNVIINHFVAVMKRSKVFSYYSTQYSKVILNVKFFWGVFCIVYVPFFYFQPFLNVYIIFDHFRVVPKYVKFCSIFLHDIPRSLLEVKIFWVVFYLVYMCFLIYLPFFRAVTKRKKFSLVFVTIFKSHWLKLVFWGVFCSILIVFLDFLAISGQLCKK